MSRQAVTLIIADFLIKEHYISFDWALNNDYFSRLPNDEGKYIVWGIIDILKSREVHSMEEIIKTYNGFTLYKDDYKITYKSINNEEYEIFVCIPLNGLIIGNRKHEFPYDLIGEKKTIKDLFLSGCSICVFHKKEDRFSSPVCVIKMEKQIAYDFLLGKSYAMCFFVASINAFEDEMKKNAFV